MRILLAYFSATQNTARIADVIGAQLMELGAEVDVLDMTTPKRRKPSPDMRAYEGAVFGSPIHYMRAPKIVREWLNDLKARETPCALFFTFGGFQVHPAHQTTVEILSRNGFRVLASAEFPGKHTYNLAGWEAMAGRPAESELNVAREYARLIYGRFSGRDPHVLGEMPGGSLSLEVLDKMENSIPRLFQRRPGREGAECRMCLLCEDLCPSGAMNAETGEADADRCICCLRCVAVCPDEILTFLDLSAFFPKKMEMEQETPQSLGAKQSTIYR
jgi:menaquinone-dependent protoporphyrinogen IX oxidase/ferredoxin